MLQWYQSSFRTPNPRENLSSCDCPTGYKFLDGSCHDVNECLDRLENIKRSLLILLLIIIPVLVVPMGTVSTCLEATNVPVTLDSKKQWEQYISCNVSSRYDSWWLFAIFIWVSYYDIGYETMLLNAFMLLTLKLIFWKESGECADVDECLSSPCIGGWQSICLAGNINS